MKSYDKLWHLYNGHISAPTHRWSPVEGPQTFHMGFWLSPDVSNKYAYCTISINSAVTRRASGWFGRNWSQVSGHSPFGRRQNVVRKLG